MSNTEYARTRTLRLTDEDLQEVYRAVVDRTEVVSVAAQTNPSLLPSLRRLRSLIDQLGNSQ